MNITMTRNTFKPRQEDTEVPKRISKKDEDRIIELKRAGFTQNRIAELTGLSDFTVKRVWRERRKKVKKEPRGEPVSELHAARVVRLVPNQRMVMADIEGGPCGVRLIKKFGKPDVSGRSVRECERIEDDLWRVVRL